jgi:hypothetical protein
LCERDLQGLSCRIFCTDKVFTRSSSKLEVDSTANSECEPAS